MIQRKYHGFSSHFYPFVINKQLRLYIELVFQAAVTSAPRKSFASRIPPLGRSGSSENKHGSEAKINSMFDKYRNIDLLQRRKGSPYSSQLLNGCGKL